MLPFFWKKGVRQIHQRGGETPELRIATPVELGKTNHLM